jgi:hypothetical protein
MWELYASCQALLCFFVGHCCGVLVCLLLGAVPQLPLALWALELPVVASLSLDGVWNTRMEIPAEKATLHGIAQCGGVLVASSLFPASSHSMSSPSSDSYSPSGVPVSYLQLRAIRCTTRFLHLLHFDLTTICVREHVTSTPLRLALCRKQCGSLTPDWELHMQLQVLLLPFSHSLSFQDGPGLHLGPLGLIALTFRHAGHWVYYVVIILWCVV